MKKLLYAAIAALALAACAKQESVRPVQQGEVRFTTNIQTYTVKATDTAFENNDQIGIFAGAPIGKNNVKAVVTGTSLLPVTPIKWVDGNDSPVEFVAYYPYAETATLTDYSFAVKADQRAAANYTGSDLMLAKKSSAPTENAVELAFSHALSKVVITVTNSVPETTVSKVEFEGVATAAKVNLSTGAISDLGTADATITANATGTAYQLILLPQSASPKVNVYLSNGNKYTYELASAFTFKAGKKASAALVVNPQQEAGVVEFSFTVTDWEVDADALEFGDPTVEAAESWAVMGLGGDWETGVAMTEDEYGNWSADITYAEGDEFKLKKGDTWVGMKPDWAYFGLGDFGNDTNFLQEGDEAINIVLQAAGEYHLFFAPDTKWFVVTAKGTTPDPGTDPTTGKLTVNVYNGAGWANVFFHAWLEAGVDSKVFTGEWPGVAAAATDVVVGENSFKSFVIDAAPLNADNIYYILSNNDGAQTINLKFPLTLTAAETTVYLELKADKTVAQIADPEAFEPEIVTPPAGPVWAVTGLAGDWATEHAMTQDETDANLWTIDVTLGAGTADAGGFKFKLKGEEWSAGEFGIATGETNSFEIGTEPVEITLAYNAPGSQNIILTPVAMRYNLKLYVDGPSAGKLLVTKL